MSVTDPIADLLTRIRNACKAEHRHVDVRWSKMKEAIVKILVDEGFIESFRLLKDGSKVTLRIVLKFAGFRSPVIKGLHRVSTPGGRRYVSHNEIPHVLRGMGMAILSTSQGVIAGHTARAKGIGGELLCKVW